MQKTLLADKGEIRVGSKYQADVTPALSPGESLFRRILPNLSKVLFTKPSHVRLQTMKKLEIRLNRWKRLYGRQTIV